MVCLSLKVPLPCGLMITSSTPINFNRQKGCRFHCKQLYHLRLGGTAGIRIHRSINNTWKVGGVGRLGRCSHPALPERREKRLYGYIKENLLVYRIFRFVLYLGK